MTEPTQPNLTEAEAEEICPFSNGSQFSDWQDRNCHRCRKYDVETFTGECDLDLAIFEAWAGEGTVSAEIGRRMGYPGPLVYSWDCPEREPRS